MDYVLAYAKDVQRGDVFRLPGERLDLSAERVEEALEECMACHTRSLKRIRIFVDGGHATLKPHDPLEIVGGPTYERLRNACSSEGESHANQSLVDHHMTP